MTKIKSVSPEYKHRIEKIGGVIGGLSDAAGPELYEACYMIAILTRHEDIDWVLDYIRDNFKQRFLGLTTSKAIITSFSRKYRGAKSLL